MPRKKFVKEPPATAAPVQPALEAQAQADQPSPSPVAGQPSPTPSAAPEDKAIEERKIRAFIRRLPAEVKAADELVWVRDHPVMLSRIDKGNSLGKVEVTLADLKRAPHGPAPSKNAVQLLRYHVQNPIKFFDKALEDQHKRAAAEKNANEGEGLNFLDDLTEVRKLIREATERYRVREKKQKSVSLN